MAADTMASRAKPRTRRAPRNQNASDQQDVVRIRMYNVGFGDCFLLFIPAGGVTKKVLIDCGSFKYNGYSVKEIVDAVIADITDPDGVPRVDVLVATHRHKDHIIGFADPRWHAVEVKEVWLPWVEDPRDPVARRLRASQARFVSTLYRALAATPNLADDNKLELLEIVLNAQSNGDALDMLNRGFKGDPQRHYLPDRNHEKAVLRAPALPGVTVHVLGPPHDEAVMRAMDPDKGEAFLSALEAEAGDPDNGQVTFNFGKQWVEASDLKAPASGPRLDPKDEVKINKIASERDWGGLAARVDEAINNTSLFLVFKVGSLHLLFPGDAQWGPWRAILDDPDACELLSRTNFYKVGHHGSHNATPVSFVKKHLARPGANGKRKDLWAMVSVTPFAQWADIPREPLLEELAAITSMIVRSDSSDSVKGFIRKGNLWIEAAIPTTLA